MTANGPGSIRMRLLDALYRMDEMALATAAMFA